MSPIITHEDELELAKTEKDLASQIKRLAKAQESLIDSQKNMLTIYEKSIVRVICLIEH